MHDPLQVLCEIVAKLHDERGRVAIPGFYDCVLDWGEAERRFLARTAPSDGEILRETGATIPWGEKGYSIYERLTLHLSR